MGCQNERTNGWNNTYDSLPPANLKTGLLGSQLLLPSITTEGTPLWAYRPTRFYSVTRQPSFHHPSKRQTTRPLSNGRNKWHGAEPGPLKQSIKPITIGQSRLPSLESTTRYG